MYFITCETDCELVHVGTIVRELQPTQILHTFCCRPPELGHWLPKRLVVSIPHNLFSRKQLQRMRGVVRIRTFDGAKDYVQVQNC